MRLRTILLGLLFFFMTTFSFTAENDPNNPDTEPQELIIYRNAFPDIIFTATYNDALKDWQIKAAFSTGTKDADGNPIPGKKSATFIWCEGRLLPEYQLKNTKLFLPLLEEYPYHKELQSPSTYTQAQIEQYRQAGLASNRHNEPFPSQFLLDFIYSSSTRKIVEQHLARIKFLGHKVTVNERIVKPLAAVEKRLLEESKTNQNIAAFLKDVDHIDGYNWREIRDVERKSLHSIAIAIDFLPPKLNKHMYWRWTKDQKGDKWMLTPLKSRWMPPYDVINIFEEEGFVWGGKWLVWDNMHFEYRPELIEFYRQSHKE